jgi:hypothetical protein
MRSESLQNGGKDTPKHQCVCKSSKTIFQMRSHFLEIEASDESRKSVKGGDHGEKRFSKPCQGR